MYINEKYLKKLLEENKILKQYCVDTEDLLSFMLDYVISNMHYDFNINVNKNELIVENEIKLESESED